MRTRQIKKEYQRGEPIRIIGGNNKGHLGWLNDSKKHRDADKVFIIIDDKGDIYDTWALTKNIGPIRKVTASYWEAVLAGCPEIELGLNDIAWRLAECQLTSATPATTYLDKRFQRSVADLDAMGGKAKVRRIVWKPAEEGARKRGADAAPQYQRPSDMEDDGGMVSA